MPLPLLYLHPVRDQTTAYTCHSCISTRSGTRQLHALAAPVSPPGQGPDNCMPLPLLYLHPVKDQTTACPCRSCISTRSRTRQLHALAAPVSPPGQGPDNCMPLPLLYLHPVRDQTSSLHHVHAQLSLQSPHAADEAFLGQCRDLAAHQPLAHQGRVGQSLGAVEHHAAHRLHDLLVGGVLEGAVQAVLLQQLVEGGPWHAQPESDLGDGQVLLQQPLNLLLGHVLRLGDAAATAWWKPTTPGPTTNTNTNTAAAAAAAAAGQEGWVSISLQRGKRKAVWVTATGPVLLALIYRCDDWPTAVLTYCIADLPTYYSADLSTYLLQCWWTTYCVDILQCWPTDLILCWPTDLILCWHTDLILCWPTDLILCWPTDLLRCWPTDLPTTVLMNHLLSWHTAVLTYRPNSVLTYRPYIVLTYRPTTVLTYRPTTVLTYRPTTVLT